MKKHSKFSLFLVIFILFVSSLTAVLIIKNRKITFDDIYNLDTISKEFMDNYFEEFSKIASKPIEEKENILIVTSLKKIKDNHGASNVVEAPNHTYFLEYNSKEEKDNALKEFNNDKSIYSVDENNVYKIEDNLEVVEATYGTFNSWGVAATGLDRAVYTANQLPLDDIVVAVIDTGLNVSLFEQYFPNKLIGTYDAKKNNTTEMYDNNGHGTHVTGTVAEATPSNVKILNIKISNDGYMTDADIINGINYANNYEGVQVVNMSFGGYGRNSSTENALLAGTNKNIINVAAAGNDSTNSSHFPSNYNKVISISAVEKSFINASFSNWGPYVDYAMPGSGIVSLLGSDSSLAKEHNITSGFAAMNGTSMACPHAAAAIAILKSYNKNLTYDQVNELLMNHVTDKGNPGRDDFYGNGIINFTNANWCEDNSCDDYHVFAIDQNATLSAMNVSTVNVLNLNYGSEYNLYNSSVVLKYDTNQETTKKLWELDDAIITGYDPYASGEQTVTLKYQNVTTTFKVTNPSTFPLGFEYEDTSGGVTITKYIDNGLEIGKIALPDKYNGKNVVSLKGNTTEKSLIFADSSDYTSFRTMIIPEGLNNIGDYALYGNNLDTIKFINKPNVDFGKYALANSEYLITIDGKVNSISEGTFKNNNKLRNIEFTTNILNIPAYAFEECHNILSINFDSDIQTIGDKAFYNTERLTQITLGDGLVSIGESAFEGSAITSINLPSTLTEIGEKAFASSKLQSIFIPQNVDTLGKGFLNNTDDLESIVVDNRNATFDSHDNANGIIDSESNTLIKGIGNTIIPSDVTVIGEEAFAYTNIVDYTVPDQIVEIKDRAFYEANKLENVTIKRNVKTFGTDVFKNTPAAGSGGTYKRVTLHVYFDSNAKTYAKNNKIVYDSLAPSTVFVSRAVKVFEVYSTVKPSDISYINLYYAFSKYTGNTYNESTEYNGRKVEYTDDYTITYQQGDSFRFGDTYYTLSGVDENGEEFSVDVLIEVTKATPTYSVPENLNGEFGSKLSTVTLPKGFTWNNPDEVLSRCGDFTYSATYTPDDATNYKVVDNVSIPVHIENPRIEIVPEITTNDMLYTGGYIVDPDDIVISNMDSSDYRITSALLDNSNVGTRKVSITIELTDQKYLTHSLAEGQKTYTYKADIKVTPIKITKPTAVIKEYIYTGSDQTFELENFDSTYMTISGNTKKNAGTYDVTIKLSNTNYAWDDGTTNDLTFKFTIQKATVTYQFEAKNQKIIYDELPHGITVNVTSPENYVINYMDSSGKYTLVDCPTYTDLGFYTIKFKVFIDENYNEAYGEATLTILSNEISYEVSTFEGMEDGKNHTISVTTLDPEAVIKYSTDGTTYNLDTPPKYKTPGEYKIYYKITDEGFSPVKSYAIVKIYGVKSIGNYGTLYNNIIVVDKNNYNDLKNSFRIYAPSYVFKHLDEAKKDLNIDTMRTGDYVRLDLINGTKIIDYQIAYAGDANGDGKISSLDYVRIKNKIMGSSNITGEAYIKAADANKDGKISSLDYVRIKNKIMEGDK